MDNQRTLARVLLVAVFVAFIAPGCQSPLPTSVSDLIVRTSPALSSTDSDSIGGLPDGMISTETEQELTDEQAEEIEPLPSTSELPPPLPDLTTDGVIDAEVPGEINPAPPRTSVDEIPGEYWDITIEEALTLGLSQSTVLRDLGGRVLTNPDGEPTAYDPAIQESDPIFGEQAALAQFDAALNGTMNFAKNDNVFNNTLAGGGAREVYQDLYTWNWGVDKTAATGTRFSLTNSLQHESTSEPSFAVQFNHFWTATTEATIRQPLLQGRGVVFNRIAGPNAQPGFRTSSGVLLSRVNEDISIAQFEAGVRTYVQQLLNAYWDLNFAYRNYDAAKHARQTALDTWQLIKARFDNQLPGGEADKEAQTRELFFLFDLQVEQALNGDSRRGITGVLQAEANLRRLLGLPQSDGRFLRPADAPVDARLAFDWNELVELAMENRIELRSQRYRIKRRELELIAAKNFLLPRFDGVVRYRNNGFGDDLTGGTGRFSSAGKDYYSGDHQEWEAGVQFNATLGFRQGYAGVRSAELNLIRDRAVLDEQQQQILFGLGNSIRRLEQGYVAMQLAYNRMLAAQETVDARLATFEAEAKAANELLDAQQRLADAQTEFFRAQTDYAVAQVTVQDEAGVLLPEFGVVMSEEPSDWEISGSCTPRFTILPPAINYCLSRPWTFR